MTDMKEKLQILMQPLIRAFASTICSALPFLFIGSDAFFLIWLIMGMSRKAR